MISYSDFEKIDVRVGKITKVEETQGLRNPAYKMTIDFGEKIRTKISLGQYTKNYTTKELIGRLVMCIVNFAPKQIGKYTSEVLTLGFKDENGNVVLAAPEREVSPGERMF